MIDRLQRIAQSVSRLASTLLVTALLCFAYAIFIALTSTSVEDDRHLFPSVLGFLWLMSWYAFVETFRYVPPLAAAGHGYFARLRHKLARLWYWIIGLVFLASAAAVAAFTVRVLVIWFRDDRA